MPRRTSAIDPPKHPISGIVRELVRLGNELLVRQENSPSESIFQLALRELLDGAVERCEFGGQGAIIPDSSAVNIQALCNGYEELLDQRPTIEPDNNGTPVFRLRRGARRKVTGAYYTPPLLIDQLIHSALEPVLNNRMANAKSNEEGILGIRVCDPACGTGHILLAVARRLARELARVRAGDCEPSPSENRRALGDVIDQCIFGIDNDPLAVELCRAALRENGGKRDEFSPARSHIRHADALYDDDGQLFDVILGNPPHGAEFDQHAKGRLHVDYRKVAAAGNSAAYFVARASAMVKADGRVGFVLPKSFTYSHAWAGVRELIAPRLVAAVDVGRAWPEVRLEQVLVTWSGSHCDASSAIDVGQLMPPGISRLTGIPRDLVRRLDVVPTGLNSDDQRLLKTIERTCAANLASVCFTQRGTALQRHARPAGPLGLLAGKDLHDFAPPRPNRYLDPTDVVPPQKLRCTEPGQVVFQNIVAHITRPANHVRLIGTLVDRRYACLDTVNLIHMTTDRVQPALVCGLLLSDLVNWFVYTCIYNRAVRTMHFDNFVFAKIPIPSLDQLDLVRETCSEVMSKRHSAAAWQALNQAVFDAYGIPSGLRRYVTAMHRPRWETLGSQDSRPAETQVECPELIPE